MGKAVLSFVFAAMTAAISAAEIVSGSGFVQCREKGKPTQKTLFKIDADKKRVVVTVECTAAKPDELRLKCSVLGGALACPISTPIECGFEAK